MASTLQQFLPRSIRPSTLLCGMHTTRNGNTNTNTNTPTDNQYGTDDIVEPVSPRPRRKSGTSRLRRFSRRVSSIQEKHQKKKTRKGSLTATSLAQVSSSFLILDEETFPVFVVPTQKEPTPLVLQWMEDECPHDLVPKILAFCGPQTTAALSKCGSRFWYQLIGKDETWKVLCEELYKWREGDKEPVSWREFYKMNPAVPTDYSTVSKAVDAIRDIPVDDKKTAVTIWLRPQEHRVKESLILQMDQAHVTLETMQTTMDITAEMSRSQRKRRLQPLASLLLQTRRRNKPLIHVAAGQVTLRRLRLGHYCGGFNLWNGNAAVQVQPLPAETGEEERRIPTANLPTASLSEVEIISHSGRGIVINDGGDISISKSYIHDCAATGIYVGSHACHLTIEHSDVVANGHGNTLAASVRASGVSGGHSGFYLENGNAAIRQCNITNNSSCGISVSSTDSRLELSHSDVCANGGSNQIEVAFGGFFSTLTTTAQFGVFGTDNNVAKTGLVKVRSMLGLQSCFNSNRSPAAGRRGRSHSEERGTVRLEEEEEVEDDEDEEDLERLQNSFVVVDENLRFGELIEI